MLWRVTASRTCSIPTRARSSLARPSPVYSPPTALRSAWTVKGDNFVERLWRSVKYEEVYLRAYESVSEARTSIGRYLDFYNGRRYRRGKSVQTTGTTSLAMQESNWLTSRCDGRFERLLIPGSPRLFPAWVLGFFRLNYEDLPLVQRQAAEMSRTFDKPLTIAVHDTHQAAHAPFSASNFFKRQWRVTTDLRITSVIVNARCSGGFSEY